jgi:hypothetical protein
MHDILEDPDIISYDKNKGDIAYTNEEGGYTEINDESDFDNTERAS